MNTSGDDKRYVFVQAHRGYSSVYPEQTMLAFRKAVEVGADRLEMDMALTADGEVVLMHDDTVDRTTNGHGPVIDFTLEALKQLDAGSWKDARFQDEPVPTLREVLEASTDAIDLNLEVKVWRIEERTIRRTIEAGLRLVVEMGALGRVVFSSFSIDALLAVRAIEPTARLLLLDWVDPSKHDGLTVAIDHDLYAWSTRPMYATQERIERAAIAGLSTHIGGVALDQRTLDFATWGVSGLSADDPESLIGFLKRNGWRSG